MKHNHEHDTKTARGYLCATAESNHLGRSTLLLSGIESAMNNYLLALYELATENTASALITATAELVELDLRRCFTHHFDNTTTERFTPVFTPQVLGRAYDLAMQAALTRQAGN